jgi:hypothetical protein
MTSPSSPSRPSAEPSDTALRAKLTPARFEELRQWVEGSNRSYRQIGAAMGLSVSTISRYVAQEGWRRPPGAAVPARISRQRERVAAKLWRLTERHAEALQDQPIEVAGRHLQPLARLTRILGDMEKHAPPQPGSAAPDAAGDAEPPSGRSIHELRDELAAHLARISEEWGYGWEEPSWWFDHGGGI